MHQAPADRLPRRTLAPWCIALSAYFLTSQWQLWDSLSSFGLANALMLGLLARQPQWRSWHSYAAIAVASLISQLLGLHTLVMALFHATANTLGVALGVALLARLPPATLQLRRENSPLYVLTACLLASTVTSLLQWAAPGTGQQLHTLALLLITEGMNHLLVVPLVLSYTRQGPQQDIRQLDPLPLLALLLCELVAFAIDGPGTIAFTLPAFIWCALRYSLFFTTSLFALFSLWKCQTFVLGYHEMEGSFVSGMAALRLALSLLWLGPLTVACSHAARKEVLQRLHYASEHDFLTRTLERGTFVQRSEAALALLYDPPAPMAMLLLDIDHFKKVNDTHGHSMGDQVLQGFADCLLQQLQDSVLLGRYGGEEFCVCLPGVSLDDALVTAEKLRAAVQGLSFPTPQGEGLQITVSVGMAHYAAQCLPTTLEQALALADAQLYRAKEGGRNRVEYIAMLGPAMDPSEEQAPLEPALERPAAPDLSFRG